ncbi:hypothetical protein TH5_04385 [Thalassospira xianhensis MCCC 1A02616]|uniref:Tyr recombinase domain-containing protein n=1 Tax=Thalassospira xianhensis MCCC 1A02616 TaxID=1177929 RepID=A0A367UGA4_9PROT|nr:hypothetical protein TH5_04385 [Thalassospira xianhensis MCCC 1A02616]
MVTNRRQYILELASEAGRAMDAALAPATRAKYESAWKRYQEWCALHGIKEAIASPRTVILFLTARAKITNSSSLGLDLASIRHFLAKKGTPLTDPKHEIKRFRRGLARHRARVSNAKLPLTPDLISQMLSVLPSSIKGRRDRTMLLLGFSGALRRSELVSLTWNAVRFDDQILRFVLGPIKNSVDSDTRVIPRLDNDFCAWQAMRSWRLETSGQTDFCFCRIRDDGVINAPVSDRYVARLIQRQLKVIGKNPDDYAGHSLRSGFATSAYWAGVQERDIRKVTGHRSERGLQPYLHARERGPHVEIFKMFDKRQESE